MDSVLALSLFVAVITFCVFQFEGRSRYSPSWWGNHGGRDLVRSNEYALAYARFLSPFYAIQDAGTGNAGKTGNTGNGIQAGQAFLPLRT